MCMPIKIRIFSYYYTFMNDFSNVLCFIYVCKEIFIDDVDNSVNAENIFYFKDVRKLFSINDLLY